jgi:thymidylate synthase
MEGLYKPLAERTPDPQYIRRVTQILDCGIMAKDTPQGIGALTRFGNLPPMTFDLSNGVPLLTERSMAGFWRKPIAEIIAFINGARTIDEIESYGCDFWNDYRDKDKYRAQSVRMGLEPGDMGPGSYGPAFHDYPMPDGGTFNQLQNIVEQLQQYPNVRSHRVVPWIPYYTPRGPRRKVMVTPCHGTMHFRVLDSKLNLHMRQDSADLPIGVPNNMIQYAALLLMVAQVTGLKPWNYIHSFSDAHIYENQIEKMVELIGREPRPFPILKLDPTVMNLFDFRAEHFTLEEYDPHPGMKIPFTP